MKIYKLAPPLSGEADPDAHRGRWGLPEL